MVFGYEELAAHDFLLPNPKPNTNDAAAKSPVAMICLRLRCAVFHVCVDRQERVGAFF